MPRHMLLVTLFGLGLTCCPGPAARGDEPLFNGRKLSDWLTVLREDPTPRKRRGAVVALGQIAAADKDSFATAIFAVGKAMQNDAVPAVRQQAASVLGQQKVDDAAIILLDLKNAVRQEKDPAVRREVAVTLGRFGKLARQAVPALTEALKDPDLAVKSACVEALGRVGPDAHTAAPAILEALKSNDKALTQAAVFALGRVDPEDKSACSAALVRVLKASTDVELRREAITSLGLLGDASAEVMAALTTQLSDPNPEHRILTLVAVGALGTGVKAVEAELTRILKSDEDKNVRRLCVRTWCKALGTDAVRLTPLLIERLKADVEFEVRVAIAEEFGALGPAGKPAIPALRQAQKDPQIKVREAATAALKQIEKPIPKPASQPGKP